MRSPRLLGTATRCLALLLFASILTTQPTAYGAERPNIVLVMADDMGWGETGYYNHPRSRRRTSTQWPPTACVLIAFTPAPRSVLQPGRPC